jgi:rhodanese-related sulfurtransferase
VPQSAGGQLVTAPGQDRRLPAGLGKLCRGTVRSRGVARITIDELLADARRQLNRLDPAEALDAMRSGAVLIDIRSDSQIARDGTIAGALVIPRNVLEWRLDPASQHRHPQAPQLDDHVILLCDEGYQSSLAAATLRQLGFDRATDVDGGFQAWRAAALPIAHPTGLQT